MIPNDSEEENDDAPVAKVIDSFPAFIRSASANSLINGYGPIPNNPFSDWNVTL